MKIRDDNECMCDVCEKNCKNKVALKDHKKIHSKPVECNLCQKKFLTKVNLNKHVMRVTVPNKVHIIIDHVEDYIDATGHGLGTTIDQIVEACHSQLNKRLVSSNYWVKDLTSEIHGIKLFKAILHFNSYNI